MKEGWREGKKNKKGLTQRSLEYWMGYGAKGFAHCKHAQNFILILYCIMRYDSAPNAYSCIMEIYAWLDGG